MREYGQISPQFWIGETGKKIRGNADAQIIALYLMTSPHSHMTGVFHCPVLYMSYETGIPFEGASKGLRRLIEVGFCEYDDPSETVFVIKMAMYQIGESLKQGDNRIAGLKKELQKMPETPMKHRFIEIYNNDFCLGFDVKNISPSEAPSKPLRSQEQEQEQGQEQEQEKTHTVEATEKTGKPTPAASVCLEIKKIGIIDINPAHPKLLMLIEAGATIDEFMHAARTAKDKGKGFAYVLGVVNGQRADAAQLGEKPGKRSRSPPASGGSRQHLMMEAGRSLFAHRDEEKGHEREIEGTAEFVECDTDKPVAGIVD
ncbi:hypothetical protein C8R26_1319 [Nitrosomonas oligotropha]|uniref:Uncharacterized protein n=1 Tax=Nitrosomonas oligotropha TaxID=42354 RepID=A0A2T5HGW5_9PROT|nr:hypothetical protein [Nitrosomonas oligotropha]PTQ70823.1 hypothetical protein C8R26_1319 [Nitrosomonas oligotropha]